MKWILLLLGGLVLAGGALWRELSRSPASATTPPPVPEVARAVALAGGAEATPRTLADIRALTTAVELEAARATLTARITDGGDDVGLAHAFLSEIERRLGRDDPALAAAARAVELSPRDGFAHFMHAKALARKLQTGGMMYALKNLGAYKNAMARAVELDPSNVDARVEQAAFYLIAPKIAGGDLKTGRELVRAIEAAAPAKAAWLSTMALMSEEKTDEALAYCRAAVAAHPDDRDLRATLAGLLTADEQIDAAIREYELALKGEPRGEPYYRALYAFAKTLVDEERDLERAIDLLEEYRAGVPIGGDFLPSRAGAQWRIGLAYVALERPDDARRAFEAALELDPELESAQESLDELP